MLKALSLFANAGFGEYYLKEIGVNVVVANELLDDRVSFYKKINPETKHVIAGDICKQNIQNKIIKACEEQGGIDLIIATPPCQGMSIANAQRDSDDIRNKLVVHAMNLFNKLKPRYMLIENVPAMARTYINYRQKPIKIYDFIKSKIPLDFECRCRVLNGKHFGTPQSRSRSICLISRNGEWKHPKPSEDIKTLKDAIGDSEEFCSLESGQSSSFAWHFAPRHNAKHIEWMKHTAEGETAFNNSEHFPYVMEDGKKRVIHGFKTTYKRMSWNEPAPTVTMTNGSISSQNNVHPGRPIDKEKGLVPRTDARVLSIREILAVCGLPTNLLDQFAHLQSDGTFKYDIEYSPNCIRKVLGELFLPLLCKEVVNQIPELNESNQLEFPFDETFDDDIYICGPKDYDEQTDSFSIDLDNLIYRYEDEYDINISTMIGVLQQKIIELSNSGNYDIEIE